MKTLSFQASLDPGVLPQGWMILWTCRTCFLVPNSLLQNCRSLVVYGAHSCLARWGSYLRNCSRLAADCRLDEEQMSMPLMAMNQPYSSCCLRLLLEGVYRLQAF